MRSSSLNVAFFQAAELGAHILSGAVIETHTLDRLLPEWRDMDVSAKLLSS